MKIKTVATVLTTNSAGQVVESIPVREVPGPVQNTGGQWVDPVAVEESAYGVPARIVADPVVLNSVGHPVSSLPVMGSASYDPDAQIFFDRLPALPSAGRRTLINNYVVAAKDNGWWFEQDAVHLMAIGLDDPGYTTANDPAAMRLNLRQALYDLTAFSSPVPTTDRGFQGDGAAAYLGTNMNPATAVGANFQRNDANFAVWSLTAGTGAPSDAGYYGGANGNTIQVRDASNNATGRINQASPVAALAAVTDGRGLFAVDRSLASGAGAVSLSRNAVVLNTGADASTALLSAALQNLRYGTGSYSARQLAAGFIGGSLSPTLATHRYNDTLTYLQAVGAA